MKYHQTVENFIFTINRILRTKERHRKKFTHLNNNCNQSHPATLLRRQMKENRSIDPLLLHTHIDRLVDNLLRAVPGVRRQGGISVRAETRT